MRNNTIPEALVGAMLTRIEVDYEWSVEYDTTVGMQQ